MDSVPLWMVLLTLLLQGKGDCVHFVAIVVANR